jgi:hypothetical protein
MRKLRSLLLMIAVTAAATVVPQPTVTGTDLQSGEGVCTDLARRAMPDGPGHDHSVITQHRFFCQMRQVFFDSLNDELAARNDVILGEMDVENDLAAVAVAFPESGVLFFDVSNPASPVFKSWYRGSECPQLLIDVDCGAYVDLSQDGKVAFLSVQNLSVVPGGTPPGSRPVSEPGVEVIDVRNPSLPVLAQVYPVVSQGGVHTSRSHVYPNGSEFLFSIANGFGIEITQVNRVGGVPALTPLVRQEIDEVHDTFLANDPLDGKTYLYVAAGFESGFYVYDVSTPASPQLIGEWDLTPQCFEDWYSHTVDTTVANGRRYVTLDAETFDSSEQAPSQQAMGCGAIIGNADKPGPLWIIDATDLSQLGPAEDNGEDDDPALKEASEASLVTTWTNPAGRAGGNLLFSPHNQQVVGNRIYLTNYHGGLFVLDATAAFQGQDVRPSELGFFVPHATPTRPLHQPTVPPGSPFFSTFSGRRPQLWDAVFYKGYVLTADWHGGLYSLQYRPSSRLLRPASIPS